MYQPLRPSRSEFVPIRALKYHVRVWGEPGAGKVPLVLVHGWMDVAASWQFMVDAFSRDTYVIAPDWRGFGLTGVDGPRPDADGAFGGQRNGVRYLPGTDNYWFADYMADLDFLLDHYGGGQPVDLVGHSMGGNVAMLYTGTRPERIRRLVNLEGFGRPATRPSQAPGRYAAWMDELKAFHRGEMALKPYETADGVAQRLMKTNRRLSQDKADWLARHWAQQGPDGRWAILGDAAHKIINAQPFRVDEALELYKRIACPTLWVEASDDSLSGRWQAGFTRAEFHERLAAVPRLSKARVDDAGHMLHHDQPLVLARLVEQFIGDPSHG